MTKNKLYTTIGAAIIVPVILLVSGQFMKGKSGTEFDGPTYKVKSGDLTISVVESGTIKARDQIIIKNEVEGRTSIISIIPEGTRVKKGELLIELDGSTLTDQRIDQEIMVQNTEAAFISAKENLAVVENQAKSDVDLARLTLDFAIQDLAKYLEGEYPYNLDKAEADIKLAEEELARAQETLKWSKELYNEKYISQTELKADEIAEKKNSLNTELAKKSKDLLTEYTYKRDLAKLQSDVNQAEMAMERTERKSNASIIQAQAELKAKESEYNRQKDKLAKVEDQIKKTKIYAPEDGLAIYATSAKNTGWRNSSEPLDVGREVQEREELIYLPTGESSNATVMVHESHLKKITPGMPVIITVDALAGKTFFGTVQRIAPLPDAQSMWMNPDLKIYNTDVSIDKNDPMLRTGMSCQAEIIVQQYKNVIYVPLQAVIRVGREPTVYVKKGNTFEPRQVKVGLDDNKVICVLEGLKEGELVLLNPPLKAAETSNEKGQKDFGDGMQEKISDGLKNIKNVKSEETNLPAAKVEMPAGTEQPSMEGARPNMENLTPEQREEMRKKFEQLPAEEKEKIRKQFGGNRQQRPQGAEQ